MLVSLLGAFALEAASAPPATVLVFLTTVAAVASANLAFLGRDPTSLIPAYRG
jgi:hypothetical protein